MQTCQTILLGIASINMLAGLWIPKQTTAFFMYKDFVLFMLAFLTFLISNMTVTLPKKDLLYREEIKKAELVRISF